jgi:hypothetical protein
MIRRTVYIPMEYDDKGEPTTPDWNYEGEHTPIAAAVEEWDQRDMLTNSGSVMVAKVEETDEVPPESEWDDIKNACEGDWKPGDSWRKWLGCVEVRITTQEVPKTK